LPVFKGERISKKLLLRCIKFSMNIGQLSHIGIDILLRFEMRASDVKKFMPNFTPCEIRGGVGENAELDDGVHFMAELLLYI